MRIWAKVWVLIFVVVALGGFAVVTTVQGGLNLLWVNTLNNQVGQPLNDMIAALQQERRASVVYLATGSAEDRSTMEDKRSGADQALTKFERSARGARWAESGAAEEHIRQVERAADQLKQSRGAISARTTDRASAAAAFTTIINTGFNVFNSLATLDNQDIAARGRTVIAMDRDREDLAEEDTEIAGILASGRFSGQEPSQVAQLIGAQRAAFASTTADLPAADAARYDTLTNSISFEEFQSLEDAILAHGRVGESLPVSASAWRAAATQQLSAVSDMVNQSLADTVKRATPAAVWVLLKLILAGGLGTLAIIAAVILSITTVRDLFRQLERLRNAARDLAEQRLPAVVARLQHGDEVDVAAEAPPLRFGNDEIGQVGHAFNAVQETAVRVAVEQAELRRSVRDVFLNLARRSQALVHRQLQLLDGMERREQQAEELDDLFRVDHLATRMRRNAENLIVLSGSVAGRGWRNPIPMVDVIRGALSEVEEYARVTVLPVESAALAGRAVGDVIHLLAELIENAVSFSPPYTNVQVSGAMVANGFAVEIEDRGLGMSEADLVKANEQLSDPPEFNLTSTAQLGLFVVGRLADRHGVKVRLRESVYGGTTAIVLIPSTLVVDPQDSAVRPGRRAGRGAVQVGEQPAGQLLDGAPVPVSPAPAAQSPGPRPAPGGSNARPPGNPDAMLNGSNPRQAANPDGTLMGPAGPRPHATSPDRLTGHRAADSALTRSPGRSPEGTGDAENPAAPVASRFGTAMSESDRDTAVIQAITDDTVPPTDTARPQAPAPGQLGGARTDGGRPEQPKRPNGPAQADGSDESVTLTAAGLPFRRRQASLAPALRKEQSSGAQDAPRADQPARRPDEIRRMMSSYQTGTLRGREAADQAERSGAHVIRGAGQTGDPAADHAGHRGSDSPDGSTSVPRPQVSPQPPARPADGEQS